MKPYWQGVFPAVTTQMHRDGSIDLDATARHLEVLIDSGVGGLVMCGSLGENQSLDADEKRAMVEAAVGVVAGRVPVLSGVAETSTRCRAPLRAGLPAARRRRVHGHARDGLPTARSARSLAHLRGIATATDAPLMIYNNPISYGNDVTPKLFAKLAGLDTIVAIKESSGDTRRITDMRNEVGDRFALFTGVDDLALESAVLGIDGWVAGIGLAFPYENQHLWDLTRAGRWEEALALYRWYTPLLHLDMHRSSCSTSSSPMQENGLGSEWVRAPRLPLVGAERHARARDHPRGNRHAAEAPGQEACREAGPQRGR